MKKENDYISTDMNHKKLIVGVVIIHICFLIIKNSGITDIFVYDFLSCPSPDLLIVQP